MSDSRVSQSMTIPEEFLQVSSLWGFSMLTRTWLTIVVGLAAVSTSGHPAFWVTAIALNGLMQFHMSVLGHHSLHTTLIRGPRLNDVIGRWFLLAPIGVALTSMRSNHMRHHKYFEGEEDYERDNYDLALHQRNSPRGFILWMIFTYFGAGAVRSLARVWRGEMNVRNRRGRDGVGRWLSEWGPVGAVQAVIGGVLWWATGHLWAYLVLWALPIVTVLVGLSATRATLEHADPGPRPHRLMTFPSNALERYVIGCFNFNYHAEHHRFPSVPACNLERLHVYLVSRHDMGDTVIVPSYLKRVRQILRELRGRVAERSA